MIVVGYRAASGSDPTGGRTRGYRIYGVDHVDGVVGLMPINEFLPGGALREVFPHPLELMLGKRVTIHKDSYGRLCEFEING